MDAKNITKTNMKNNANMKVNDLYKTHLLYQINQHTMGQIKEVAVGDSPNKLQRNVNPTA
jgi:hypothetical protein